MYLDEARSLIETRAFPDAEEIHPCTPEEVEVLERQLGVPLPGAVREFLLWCGHGLGDLWGDNGCFVYSDWLRAAGLDEARAILTQGGHDTSPLEGAVLVLQIDECDQFSFLRLDEGEDPPVYVRDEGEAVRMACEHFSEFVKLIVYQEFGLELEAANDARPSIVPNGLDPNAAWVEESFGWMPPSRQVMLGTLRASFKPSAGNVIAGIILGLLIAIGGLVLVGLGFRDLVREGLQIPAWSTDGTSWGMLIMVGLGGAGLAAGGLFLIRHMLRLSRSRVFIGEEGLCRARDGQYELMRWAEVGRIDESITRQSLPWVRWVLLREVPMGGSRQLTLQAADGRQMRFTPNDLASFTRFEALLRGAAAAYGFPWSTTRPDGTSDFSSPTRC